MTFIESNYVECEACWGIGRLTDEELDTWEWCPVCDGTGEVEVEPEDSTDEEI
jgi:DnaJ-class molecular chaperone